MKISESQKKEKLAKAQAEAIQKQQEHLTWLKEQNFLTVENRDYLVHELSYLQERHASLWETLRGHDFKNTKNWESVQKEMYFKMDLLKLQMKKIKEVLINNKFEQ
mgnify:CR=1 FL=1|tara:strand:+ start:793 stop:1110 length:318 start_codon:yes stop_codon:yes gene_type:complete